MSWSLCGGEDTGPIIELRRHNDDDDNVVFVQVLEYAIADALGETHIEHPVVPDAVWLKCVRRSASAATAEKNERHERNEPPPPSATGLVEDFIFVNKQQHQQQQHPCVPSVRFTLWKRQRNVRSETSTPAALGNTAASNTAASNTSSHSTRSGCQCPQPNQEWKRRSPNGAPDGTCVAATESSASSTSPDTCQVHWIDLRSGDDDHGNDDDDLFGTPAKAARLHFWRSLLGASHTASPWQNKANTETRGQHPHQQLLQTDGIFSRPALPTDCVIVQIPNKKNSAAEELLTVRLSDACPSWYVHATSHTLIVVRRLPDRSCLSLHHPLTGEPVPTPGCLWETFVVKQQGQHNDAKKIPQVHTTSTHELTAPPYIDVASEYTEELSRLLHPNVQAILRNEVLHKIPGWVAWPEQEHYSSVNKSSGDDSDATPEAAPWHVFPLCYCFPAHDISQRQWLSNTTACVPQTVNILQEICGDRLRTALFSRLDPESVLDAHTGWADLANHVIRIHVPIIVPDNHSCGVWVDGCVETCRSDRLVALDDSKIHRAFNYSTSSRIVLILDLERPAVLPLGKATGGHSEELDDFIAQFAKPR